VTGHGRDAPAADQARTAGIAAKQKVDLELPYFRIILIAAIQFS